MNMTLAGLKAFVSDLLPTPAATRGQAFWDNDNFANFLNDRRDRAVIDEFAPNKPEQAYRREDRDDRAVWTDRDDNPRSDRVDANNRREDPPRTEPVARNDADDTDSAAVGQDAVANTDTSEDRAAEADPTEDGENSDNSTRDTADNATADNDEAAVQNTDDDQTANTVPTDTGAEITVQLPQSSSDSQLENPDDSADGSAQASPDGTPTTTTETENVAAVPSIAVPSDDAELIDVPVAEDVEIILPDGPVANAGIELPQHETAADADSSQAQAAVEGDAGVEIEFPALRGIGLLQAAQVSPSDALPGLFVLPDGFEESAGIQEIHSLLIDRMKNGVSENALQSRAPQGPSTANANAVNNAAGGNSANVGANPGNSGGNAGQSGAGSGSTPGQFHTGLSLSAAANSSLPASAPLPGDGGFAGQLSTATANGAPGNSGTVNISQSAANAAATARGAAPHTSAGIQVAIHLTRAIMDGLDRINIRLNPAELGRVDVRLQIHRDGSAMAFVTTDRPETLELLQRDARGLERALQDAGLKTDSGSLNFSLRQHGQNGGESAGNGPGGGHHGAAEEEDAAQLSQAVLPLVDPDRLLDISV